MAGSDGRRAWATLPGFLLEATLAVLVGALADFFDGTLTNGRVFFDMTSIPGDDAIDGLKVDQLGNVYVSGPGGLSILSPAGTHLGTIVGPEHPHNFAWGGADGRSLYLTAQTGLYRIRLNVPGTRPFSSPTH